MLARRARGRGATTASDAAPRSVPPFAVVSAFTSGNRHERRHTTLVYGSVTALRCRARQSPRPAPRARETARARERTDPARGTY